MENEFYKFYVTSSEQFATSLCQFQQDKKIHSLLVPKASAEPVQQTARCTMSIDVRVAPIPPARLADANIPPTLLRQSRELYVYSTIFKPAHKRWPPSDSLLITHEFLSLVCIQLPIHALCIHHADRRLVNQLCVLRLFLGVYAKRLLLLE